MICSLISLLGISSPLIIHAEYICEDISMTKSRLGVSVQSFPMTHLEFMSFWLWASSVLFISFKPTHNINNLGYVFCVKSGRERAKEVEERLTMRPRIIIFPSDASRDKLKYVRP